MIGTQPGEAEEPDVERGLRQRVDLHRHRHLGEHRADERGALADQQPLVRQDSPADGCRPRGGAAARPANGAVGTTAVGDVVLLDRAARRLPGRRPRVTASSLWPSMIARRRLVGSHPVGEHRGLDPLRPPRGPRRLVEPGEQPVTHHRARPVDELAAPLGVELAVLLAATRGGAARASRPGRGCRSSSALQAITGACQSSSAAAQQPQRAGQLAGRLLRVVARARRRTCSRR